MKFYSGDQVVGRQKPAHHHEYQIFVGVVIDVSSHLYDFGCGSDCTHVGFIFHECCGLTPRL